MSLGVAAYRQWRADQDETWLGDGLPVLPALGEWVDALLAATSRDADEQLGIVAPALLPATVHAVAVQAAMAGCPPGVFDVTLAAVEAVLDQAAEAVGPEFNLEGVQATACSCAPLVVVSGRVVSTGGFEYRRRVLAATAAANAAVGRTVRLVMTNLGGGRPGDTDMSVIGNPTKVGYCVAEHPDSPWEPLHVARGLGRVDSAVTVFACDSPHDVVLDGAESPVEVAERIAGTLRQAGSLNMYWGGQALVAVNLPLARALSRAGWGRADLAGCLYELARRTPEDSLTYYESEWLQFFARPAWAEPLGTLPAVSDPRDLHVVVTGEGESPVAAVCPGWGAAGGLAMTVPVRPSLVAGDRQAPRTGNGTNDLEVPEAFVMGPVEQGVGVVDRPRIPLAGGAAAPPLRVLLFANYGAPDGESTGILHWVEQQLSGRDDIAEVEWYPSPVPTQREPQAVVRDLADRFDAVILGVGLSGSRSWKVAIDAVQFEGLGVPTVTLVARGYEDYIVRLTDVAGLEAEPPIVLVEPTDPPRDSGFDPELVENLLLAVRRR